MKKYLFMFTAAIILLNVWGTIDVSAQVIKVIEAEVEFDFRVGDKIYPAGVYRLETANSTGDGFLRLRGDDKKSNRLISVDSDYAENNQTPKLVFTQIGAEYYLTNVVMTDGGWGFAVRSSRRQKESERTPAAKKIEVAAKN
jgi:hypothetical protein